MIYGADNLKFEMHELNEESMYISRALNYKELCMAEERKQIELKNCMQYI